MIGLVNVDLLLKKSEQLKLRYENHFHTNFPERIVGWWNPVNIPSYPEELQAGIVKMENDIEYAIRTNTPIEEISQEEWNKLVF